MDVTPATGEPDDRDLDDGGLDLTPRSGPERVARSRNTRRWFAVGTLCVLAGVVVFIAVQARGATLYYKNADEAVAQRDSLGQDRFRLQGIVVTEPVESGAATTFDVEYNGVQVTVRHTGSEPALFKPGLPVVCEGRWDQTANRFDSDRILVKHTADYRKADEDGTYEKEHPDRVEPTTTADPNPTNANK